MAVSSAGAVGFKGRMMTLTVLEISSLDLAVVDDAIATHVRKSPDFFHNMPVLLSLPGANVDLIALAGLIRSHNLVPVALSNPTAEQAHAASAAGLGVFQGNKTDTHKPESAAKPVAPAQSAAPKAASAPAKGQSATRLITSPVRSGQQIYARDADLVVTAAVSEGAEILADGNIHVYGALRGRALAGAAGDANARIFCRKFEAELVAVAGCYKVAEDIQESVRGKAVQVRLSGENLLMELQE